MVAATTQTSISFTWGLPLTTSPVNEYVLECRSTVMGVDDPSPLNTAEQSVLLSSLSPGVPYSCSLTALTNANTPPPAIITATTVESGMCPHLESTSLVLAQDFTDIYPNYTNMHVAILYV